MKTFYDILKVKQNATQEEILNSYYKLEKKYINNNEMLKKLKVAKDVLTNSEARENYDNKLEEIRQNELISNINNNTINYNIKKQEDEKRRNDKAKQLEIKNDTKKREYEEKVKQIEIKNKIKKKEEEIKKQKIEENIENKINKKQEKKTKELYEEAYAQYLESLGFKVKRRWTLKRIKKLIISIISAIIICFIFWNIPIVREKLIDLYENNFIIKMIVDLLKTTIDAIINCIKRFIESW